MPPAARIDRVDAAEVSLLAAWRPVRRAERRRARARRAGAAPSGRSRSCSPATGRTRYRTALLIAHDRAAAEDIAQEAFLAALRALPRFDRRRPLRPWLHRIVVNRAIDWARARRLRAEVDVDAVAERRAAPPPDLGLGDARRRARAACRPSTARSSCMRYLLELTPGEIAAALELPRGTVNSRLRRGLDALGGVLEEEP